jgi:hypothetical protein
VSWRREGLRKLKTVEGWLGRTRGALRFAKQVHALRAQTGRVWEQGTQREKDEADRWGNTIGRLYFYLILSLNAIISLQIILLFIYFYTKIHDFFLSINRDWVHLIWTQKKKSSFSLSYSYYYLSINLYF